MHSAPPWPHSLVAPELLALSSESVRARAATSDPDRPESQWLPGVTLGRSPGRPRATAYNGL